MKTHRRLRSRLHCLLVCLLVLGPWGRNETATAAGDTAPDFTPAGDITVRDSPGPNEDDELLTIIAVTPGEGGTSALGEEQKVSNFTPASALNLLPGEPQITRTETLEDTQSTRGLVISRNPNDEFEVPFFQITGITGGTLYLDDGTTPIADGQLIPAAEAAKGLKFTPAPDLNSPSGGSFTFTVRGALDASGQGLGAPATAAITVTEVNDEPVGTPDTLAAVDEDSGPVVIPFPTLMANDRPGPANESGQELTIVSVGDAVGGNIAILDTDVVFALATDFNGTASFTYTIADNGTTDNAPDPKRSTAPTMVIIPVTPANDAPVAEGQSLSVTVGSTLTGTVTATDVDGDPLAYRVVDGPRLGALTMNPDGSFTYSSRRDGEDRFTFRANDGTADSEPATVTVQVKPRSGGHSGGGSSKPRKPAEPAEPATPEPPAGESDAEVPEGGISPMSREVGAGEPAEARMLNFLVSLPGGSTAEPLRLQVLSPTANTDAVKLVEGVAEIAGTGDGELTRQADGTPVSQVTATITFAYDPAVVSNPAELRIFYFDPRQNVWVELGGEVDPAAHTVTVQVGHFTTFAALVPRVEAPALPDLPAGVESDRLTVTGTAPAGMPVSLVINGEAQVTVATDENGRYTMEGTLAEGQNWVYVKGTGALASREWPVVYRPAKTGEAATEPSGTAETGEPAAPYTDIAGHWAEASIRRLAGLGITTIFGGPTFEPETAVTRLEFAVMVARTLGLTPVDEALAFTDVAEMPEWSLREIAAAVRAGIILGLPDGSFFPDAPVTRTQTAVMLVRALDHAGRDTRPGERLFADQEAIPAWAVSPVQTAARHGLMTGYPDGTFRPAGDTTRAEAVTVLERLLDLIGR